MSSTILSDLAGESDDDEAVQFVEPSRRRPRPVKAWQAHKPKRDPWQALTSLAEPGDPALRRNTIHLSAPLDATAGEQGRIVEHLTVSAATNTRTSACR